MNDVAAQAGFGVSTVRIWAQRAGILPRVSPRIPTYIYCLKSPIDGLVYYIGKSNNPKARLYKHLRFPTNSYMAGWFASLAEAGHKPEMVILARLTRNMGQWRAVEVQFISKYQQLGHPLLNIEVAGYSGTPMRHKNKS